EDWKAVIELIDALPSEEQSKEIWQYWSVIASYSLNPKNDTAFKTALGIIAQERSYYGFLAAELLDQPFQLNRSSQGITPEALKLVSTIPGIIRARELYLLGMQTSANREWYTATDKMTPKGKVLTGYVALSWGWNTRAIIMAAQAKHWDELGLRFPRPYEPLFDTHAKNKEIDPVWAMAIARQESAFSPAARSHVGASGLMQLMPATAKNTAKKHKVKYTKQAQLSHPKTNITLGTAYLSDMYTRFNMNQAYASAAYNAGPHRVKRWLKDRGHLPLDIWIETIPFKETRRYVQNVLAYKVIYQRLANKPAYLLSDEQLKLLAFNNVPLSTTQSH
ncbi:MAG: transglycosylase SLT domain-containing protein, partial [Pontibacterium sp.]